MSGISHIGHLPGCDSRTCGCIEQVQISAGLAGRGVSARAANPSCRNSKAETSATEGIAAVISLFMFIAYTSGGRRSASFAQRCAFLASWLPLIGHFGVITRPFPLQRCSDVCEAMVFRPQRWPTLSPYFIQCIADDRPGKPGHLLSALGSSRGLRRRSPPGRSQY